MRQDLRVPTRDRPIRVLRQMVMTVLVAGVVSLSACSSTDSSTEGWRANFFKDSDRVWAAIELSLLELDYEVTESNRFDGLIRARSVPTEDGTVIELAIDQVVRTDDQVSVYVKPSFGSGGGAGNPNLLKATADAFVKTLESKLNG